MNTLAAFYEFLDQERIGLYIDRIPQNRRAERPDNVWVAYLGSVRSKDTGFLVDWGYGQTTEAAVANLISKLDGKELIIEGETRIVEKSSVERTFCSMAEVAHG